MPIRRIQFLLLAVLLNSVSCFIDSTKNEQFTWKNQPFRAFRGIKYAESPTGALRFQVSSVYLRIFTRFTFYHQ